MPASAFASLPTVSFSARRATLVAAADCGLGALARIDDRSLGVLPLASSGQPFGASAALGFPVGAIVGYVCAVYANLLVPDLNASPQAWSFQGSVLVGLFALCTEVMA
jgi:hypothetical protein